MSEQGSPDAGRLERERDETRRLANRLRSLGDVEFNAAADRLERLQKDAHEWEVTARLHADEGWRDQVERSGIAMEVERRLLDEGRVEMFTVDGIKERWENDRLTARVAKLETETIAWRQWVADHGVEHSKCINKPCPGCDRMPGDWTGWCIRCGAMTGDLREQSVCDDCGTIIAEQAAAAALAGGTEGSDDDE